MAASNSKLKKLSVLTENENEILTTILKVLHEEPKDLHRKNEMLKKLGNYSLSLLYALSENNSEINDLLEKDEYLNKIWSTRLKKMEYPHHNIVSFDKKISISLFSQLKGIFLMDKFYEFYGDENSSARKIPSILNKACDIGIREALVSRLNMYIGWLRENAEEIRNNPPKIISDSIDPLVVLILYDVHMLSNLYWTTGCIEAALILFNITDVYLESPAQKKSVEYFFFRDKTNQLFWNKKYDDQSRPYPITLLESAVENLYVARSLSEFEQSKLLLAEEGLPNDFADIFSSEEKFVNYITNKLDNLHVPLIKSFCDNADKHAKKLINTHYPNFKTMQV